MAVEIPLFNVGFCTAAADYTAKQFHLMDVSADTVVTIAGTSGQACLGILQNKPNTGEVADVMALGVSKLVAGTGDLAAGALFMAHTDGTGVTASGVKVALGMVIIGATAGNLATVMLNPGMGGIVAAA